MQPLTGWEPGSGDEEVNMSYRLLFVDYVQELHEDLDRNRRIHSTQWSSISVGVNELALQAKLTERETSLLQLLHQLSSQLQQETIALSPTKEAVTKNKLSQDVYQQWEVASSLVLALWDGPVEILRLAITLEEDPDALSDVGLTRERLPPLLRKRLIQAPAFLFGPAPPRVKGVVRYYQSGINRSLVANVLHGKGDFSLASVRALQERLAANLPLPVFTPPREIIPDEPPLTLETLQERVDAVRRHWRENGVEDDIWLF